MGSQASILNTPTSCSGQPIMMSAGQITTSPEEPVPPDYGGICAGLNPGGTRRYAAARSSGRSVVVGDAGTAGGRAGPR